MKFSKSKGESKTKTAVDKTKFKSKKVASNGHVQKGVELAAKLVKKGSFNNRLGDLVEVNAKSKVGSEVANGRQNKKKTGAKNLSPEVRLGLELDAMLEKKASENEKPGNESPLPKRKRKGKQYTVLNKPVVLTTDDEHHQTPVKMDSPNKKKKSKKLKRTSESENDSSPVQKQNGAEGTRIDSDGKTPPKPQNSKSARKRNKRKVKGESGNDSSPVQKLKGAQGTQIELSGISSPKPQIAKAAGKKNKRKIESENNSSPVKKQNRVEGIQIDSDGMTPSKSARKKNKRKLGSGSVSSPVKMQAGAPGIQIDSDSLTPPKPKNDEAVAKKKNKGNKVNLTSPPVDLQDFSLDPKQIQAAVKSLIQIYSETKSSSKELLQANNKPILLNFLFYELHPKPKVIRFKLTHSLLSEDSDVCLIGKDLANTIDKSKTLWIEFLSGEGCSNLITEVIPLKSLLKDYMQHEYKKKLSNRFDCFLTDSRISHRAYSILGVHNFHHRRKTPTPVALKEGKTKQNIIEALKKTVSFYKGSSDRFSIQVGHTGMTVKQLQENIISAWNQYPEAFEFYWDNIRRAVIFTANGPELPIFATLNAPAGGPRPYNMVWTKKKSAPVVGELCNEKDQIATVYPSGRVTVKAGKKVDNDDDDDDGELSKLTNKQRRLLRKNTDNATTSPKKASTDSSEDEFGGRNDMIDSDLEDSMMPEMELYSDSEEEMPVAKKGKKLEKASGSKLDNKTRAGKKNQNKAKEKEEEDEDSGEFDVDKAEELYLHDLAEEKKAKAKQKAAGKGKGNKKDMITADSEEDGDSEGEVDNSAFGISSSDEYSDDDNEAAKPLFGGKKQNQMALKLQKKGGKQAQQGKNIVKDSKKNNNVNKVENNKGKLNKSLNKPGAQKNRQQSSPNNSRRTDSSPSTSDSSKKKNSFQGVKAEQTKAKKQHKKKTKNLKNKVALK